MFMLVSMSLFSSPVVQYESDAVLGPIVVQEADQDVQESHSVLTMLHRAEGKLV